jgi:hypothetical protein
MKTTTLLSPHQLAEQDVARVLEQQFGATWFPQYHRCSIDTQDAVVAVDVDPDYASRLPPDEQRTLAAQLGFLPGAALHIQSSTYHPGSPTLAEQVVQTLSRLFDGRAVAAA